MTTSGGSTTAGAAASSFMQALLNFGAAAPQDKKDASVEKAVAP